MPPRRPGSNSIGAWLAASAPLLFCVVPVSLLLAHPASAQEEEHAPEAISIDWASGPMRADIGDIAEIEVPEGLLVTGPNGTRTLLEALGNPTSGSELACIAPASEEESWFVIFEFEDCGYVKDDEKEDLDSGAILESIRRGNEAANKERRARGWDTLEVVGWEVPPRYDEVTNNLEWAIRGRSEGGDSLNYSVRLLGRRGVMHADLVLEPEDLAALMPEFRDLLAGFAFQSGHTYAEFRSGDKIAKYGLTALVTGGAAVAALKTGFLAKAWKFLVLIAVGIAAFFKKLWAGLFGKRTRHAQFGSGRIDS